MQSDIRCMHTALTRTREQKRQHDHRQPPESPGQEHHASGVDRQSLTDWLGARLNLAKAMQREGTPDARDEKQNKKYGEHWPLKLTS